MRHVALLRGLNVGGNNRITMVALKGAFEAAGCLEVCTFIQSGNVIFEAPTAVLARVAARVSKALEDDFDIRSCVILRSHSQLAKLVTSNPYLEVGAPPEQLHVAFLEETPTKASVALLDPKRSESDSFEVRGAEMFLHTPKGLGRSKLTAAWVDSKLKTTSTFRNWKTVLELARLSAES